jgi:putative acetyltransferase
LKIQIRNETPQDYGYVEEITRKAFWNLYVPGCGEHYLVHSMRSHEDFLKELAFVIEADGQIIGNIMYTKAKLIDEAGEEKEILTFGPLSILPDYQRMGYGKMLLEHSFEKAISLGYDVIVIFGNPSNYISCGFKSCKKHNICLEDGMFPSAMMVKELKLNALDGCKWVYYDSPVMHIQEEDIQRFDETLEPLEKKYQSSQEEFFIYSQSFVN